jgi:hypothetical protein
MLIFDGRGIASIIPFTWQKKTVFMKIFRCESHGLNDGLNPFPKILRY